MQWANDNEIEQYDFGLFKAKWGSKIVTKVRILTLLRAQKSHLSFLIKAHHHHHHQHLHPFLLQLPWNSNSISTILIFSSSYIYVCIYNIYTWDSVRETEREILGNKQNGPVMFKSSHSYPPTQSFVSILSLSTALALQFLADLAHYFFIFSIQVYQQFLDLDRFQCQEPYKLQVFIHFYLSPNNYCIYLKRESWFFSFTKSNDWVL